LALETIDLLAVGLTLLLFLLWWFIGYGVVFVLRRRCLLQNALLAPAVGSAVCLMFVFWLNRAGLPVARFGLVLGVSLVMGSALLWWRGRVIVPIRKYLPFAAVLLLALLLVGWPMFEFGFNWVSISNDDMANYCLLAQRVFDYGFFDGLPVQELAKNKDISAYYWYMHVKAGVRPGSELLLAFVMTLTKLSSHEVFMPVILSFHLCLISAAGALALQNRKAWRWTLMALLILSFSAQNSLGTIYQLIAQVFGLSLAAAAACLFMTDSVGTQRNSYVKYGVLTGLMFSACLVAYTEVVPILGLACTLFLVQRIVRRGAPQGIRSYVIATVCSIAFLNSYLLAAVRFLLGQAAAGTSNRFGSAEAGPVIFPFFLLPRGLGQFWGAFSHYSTPAEPWLSLSIAFGGLLILLAAAVTTLEAWRGTPVALVSLSLVLMSVFLILRASDYGLFKIAMFIQPFLIPTLVGGWMRFTQADYEEG
jgi:hypothetical protein